MGLWLVRRDLVLVMWAAIAGMARPCPSVDGHPGAYQRGNLVAVIADLAQNSDAIATKQRGRHGILA
jgi:hypothetical protein